MEQKAINISDQLNNQSNEQDEEELSMPPADNLPDLLNLRAIGSDKYLGTTYTGWYFARTFGGVTFSQALIAACRTVEDPSRFLYSAHSNFISAGKAKDPIVYKVKRTRDAKTFSNRKVYATQNGRIILEVLVSFQVHREGVERKLERQNLPMPSNLPEPTSCASLKNRKQRFFMDVPGEWRVAEMNAEIPRQKMWFKAEETPSLGDGYAEHFAASAFFSDLMLLGTSFLPFVSNEKISRKQLSSATLCHTMWFHKPFRADDWLLFNMECPIAHEERALSTGQFFNSKGELVASMAQEGMVRYDAKTNNSKSDGTSMTTKPNPQEGVKNSHSKL